jgi:DNA-binding transcriptional ArsR family regulator
MSKDSPTTPNDPFFGQLHMIAKQFRILSDPMRLQILHSLRYGELSVSEIVKITGSSQPNISKHLAILHENQLLNRRKDATSVFFSISAPIIFKLCEMVCTHHNRADDASADA